MTVSLCAFMCKSAPSVSLSRSSVCAMLQSVNTLSTKTTDFLSVFTLFENTPAYSLKTNFAKEPAPVKSADEKEPVQILTKTQSSPDLSKVSILNSTKKELNAKDFLDADLPFLKEDLSVLIVHTHTTESYTPSEKYNYTPTDTDRTCNKGYNMVRVGDEIEKVLKESGIRVFHDTTINDYPSYNGSYNRSGLSVKNHIKNDPSIKVVLDVHRDAIEGANGEKVKYTFDTDGKKAASIMLVAGSNLSGLEHDNWQTNMSFAMQLQKHTQALYPGLLRPINFRSQRFNQQLAPGAIIVEVGTNGNTLDEALLGASCFAKSLADFLKNYSS